jgi:hypothetical protein
MVYFCIQYAYMHIYIYISNNSSIYTQNKLVRINHFEIVFVEKVVGFISFYE